MASFYRRCQLRNGKTAQGTRTLHVGAGTGNLPLTVTISPDGTYVWKADGKAIRGQWKPGKEDYPVILQNGYEGKNTTAARRRSSASARRYSMPPIELIRNVL